MTRQKLKQLKYQGKTRLIPFFALILFILSTTFVLAKTINLDIGDAQVIKFDSDISEIFIVNPDIADIQLSSPRTAYLFGKLAGVTKFFALNNKKQEVLKADIIVSHNLAQLKELIAPFDPYGLVTLRSAPGAIIIEGQAESPKTADDIVSIAKKFMAKEGGKSGYGGQQPSPSGGGSSDQTVINRLVIKSPVQVSLHVKVAEVNRRIVNNLGINWQATIQNAGNFNFGMLTGRAPVTALPIVSNTVTSITQDTDLDNAIGFNFSSKHANINAVLDAMSKDGLVTILAEPNLMAISGETASFLAGGEFPYPVPQGFGQVTIEFKQFGVSLAFTPTVLGGGLISMRVRPEVSELDNTISLNFQGQIIPGISTRRAETTIELASGQTFAIAGLLKNESTSGINAVPGLGDLPVLGALFRSNKFQNEETELVILVTPYLVEPVSGKEMPLPTDGLSSASLIEQVFERRLLKEGPEKGQAPAFGPGGIRLIGPAGFSIE